MSRKIKHDRCQPSSSHTCRDLRTRLRVRNLLPGVILLTHRRAYNDILVRVRRQPDVLVHPV